MRVPGGDITSTVAPVSVGRHRAAVMEVANGAKMPVTLALALRSISLDGTDGVSHRLELVDGRMLAVDTVPALLLPRRPAQAGGAIAGGDGFPGRLLQGDDLRWDGPIAGVGAEAVVVYPLPHGTSLRFTVLGNPGAAGERHDAASLSTADLDRLQPDRLPELDAIVRGWASVLDQSCRASFPDPGLTELADAARARLTIEAPRLPDAVVGLAPGAGLVLSGLAAAGRIEECRTPLLHLASTFPAGNGAAPEDVADTVSGVVDAAVLCDEAALTDTLLEPVMALVAQIDRAGRPPLTVRAQLALADLADLAGQPDAATHLRRQLTSEQRNAASPARPELDTVMAMAQTAAPSGRWPSPAAPDDGPSAARFWLTARRLLLDRPALSDGGPDRSGSTKGTDQPNRVDILPSFPTAWLGGPLETHALPVAGARVSFALRWHGYRPALLWETTGRPITLRCPGLDPDWSTTQRAGEVLLAGSSERLPEAPSPGDSFG
jgi:hypothetical protein